jgi:hypothetical protein
MHDPMVVACEIRRPWPRKTSGAPSANRWSFKGPFWCLAGRTVYWPSMITVWHVEPGGTDSGDVCKHYRKNLQPDGKYAMTILNGWRFHVHHWKLQVTPLQNLRRWALTRCAWCKGRSAKTNRVNCSNQWDGPRGRWWQGEPNLFHGSCISVELAHRLCSCDTPTGGPTNGSQSFECTTCGRHAGWRQEGKEWRLRQRRIYQSVPVGEAPSTEVTEAAQGIWDDQQAFEALRDANASRRSL